MRQGKPFEGTQQASGDDASSYGHLEAASVYNMMQEGHLAIWSVNIIN